MKNNIRKLLNQNTKVEEGDKEKIERQHASGKLSARDRINLLLDDDSFIEVDKFSGNTGMEEKLVSDEVSADSIVGGYGTLDGRLVFVYAQDFTVAGGSVGEKHAEKIVKIQKMALKMGAPIISLMDSKGGKIEEGIDTISGYGKILHQNTISSGVIPQISILVGPCAGGISFSTALSDFTFMVDKTSSMFVNGPQIIKSQTNEDISQEELGGAMVHNSVSGGAHFLDYSEEECINRVRELLSFLPSNNLENAPVYDSVDNINRVEDALNQILPENNYGPYDMKEIVKLIADEGYLFEIQPYYAENIITGYIRLNGKTIGVVANQANIDEGLLSINAVDKAARFIRTCDAFDIPLLNLVDVAGFLASKSEEQGGIIRHGAKMIYGYSEATVPKITLVIRKAYGSAYLAMCSKELGADQVFAWPGSEISIISPEAAANIIYKDEIANSADPILTRKEKIEEYRALEANPYNAAKKGYIDDIILPSITRPRLISAFDMLETKRESRPGKKHGNLPV